MKTTFKQYLQEAAMPKAESEEDLLASIRNGEYTLDGSHIETVNDFKCGYDSLTSLKGVPLHINGYFDCSDNKLISLKGGPLYVKSSYFCGSNKLTSLEGVPPVINSSLFCSNNDLRSLKDIHKHIHEIGHGLYLDDNPIESHVLGLLKIKKLAIVTFASGYSEVQAIINKYLPEGDIFVCQQELIDAGLEEYAQI